MLRNLLVLGLALSPLSAMADGHANLAAGEKVFKKCQACHVVKDPDGNTLAGRSGRTGPNLYGIVGRQAGTVPEARYQKSIKEAGASGLIWTEEELAKYLMDPSGYLKDYLGSSSARSGMSFKLRKEQEATDISAFLAQFGPEG